MLIWTVTDRVLGPFTLWSRGAADHRKIEDMVVWPVPKDLKGLRGFMGLTSYYRKFVKDFGKIVWPLTRFLKKDNFLWDEQALLAFETLKTTLTTIPALAVPNFEKEFIVETDVFGKGLGVVLMQEGKRIAYMSQTLFDKAQKRSQYMREN